MGLNLTTDELHTEATPSQRKAITRLTAQGELPIRAAELWTRGVVWVLIGTHPSVARSFTITPRGRVDEIL